MDSIDWEKAKVAQRNRSIKILYKIIDQLVLFDDIQRSNYYLQRFESYVEHNSQSHLEYLNIGAFIKWEQGDYIKARYFIDEFDKLSLKLSSKGPQDEDIENTRALVLRDSGDYEEALKNY